MIGIIKWENHPETELYLSNLYDEYGSNYQMIIKEMNKKFDKEFTYNSIRNRIRRSPVIEYIAHKRGKGIFSGIEDDEVYEYEEIRDDIQEVIKRFKYNFKNKKTKVLVLSDLHIPDVNFDNLEKAILDNQDADIVVLAGDLVNLDSIRKYGNIKNISVEDEYKKLFKIMKVISDIFSQIIVITGNHDRSLYKYFSNKIVQGLSGYLNLKHPPLEDVMKYFDNVNYINHYFCQLGDLIIAHPDRYSKVRGRTVRNVLRERLEREHYKEYDNFSTVMIGHSHDVAEINDFSKRGLEIGCLCKEEIDYHNRGKGKKWIPAYGIAVFDNCKLITNETRVIRI
ncbi:MAG: metallophosphoesterase [bacterium]